LPADSQTPPCASENQARAAAADALRQAEAAKAAAEADLAQKGLAAADADAALVALRKSAQQNIREILDDHMALIAALQEAVAGTAQADSPVPVVATSGPLPGLPTGLPGG